MHVTFVLKPGTTFSILSYFFRLRHCATSQKFAGSIPDEAIGIFSLTYSFRLHYGPAVDSASNRNEHQGYPLGGKAGRYLWLITLPSSCVDFLEIHGALNLGDLRTCTGL